MPKIFMLTSARVHIEIPTLFWRGRWTQHKCHSKYFDAADLIHGTLNAQCKLNSWSNPTSTGQRQVRSTYEVPMLRLFTNEFNSFRENGPKEMNLSEADQDGWRREKPEKNSEHQRRPKNCEKAASSRHVALRYIASHSATSHCVT